MKRVLAISLVSAFVLVGLAVLSAAAQEKAAPAKKARWSGAITRSDKEGGTITVRKSGTNVEKIIHVDSSTKWTKQEGGKVVDLDAGEVKDGDRVICEGTYDDKGEFHATRVDKRLPK
jgi:hypothetical protein